MSVFTNIREIQKAYNTGVKAEDAPDEGDAKPAEPTKPEQPETK